MTQTPMTSSPAREQRHVTASQKWVMAIGVLKLLKAVLFVLMGIGALKLLHKNLMDEATRYIIALRFDPEGKFVSLILDKLALINPHKLREISYGIFAYAALDVIEGAGLVLRKRWAEYVTLVLTASFLPWEVYELIHRVTQTKVILTLLNVAVVIFLAVYVRSKAKIEEPAGDTR